MIPVSTRERPASTTEACPTCQSSLSPHSEFCGVCGTQVQSKTPALVTPGDADGVRGWRPTPGPREAAPHPLALLSVILGLLAWFALPVVGAFGAILTGHMANRRLEERPG